MAFLDYNLANLRGINEKVGQISSQAFQGKQAAKGRFFGSVQNLVGTLNRRSEAEKLADAKALEADKGRTAQNRAAARLADERGGVRDWERGEGFEQTKELEKLRADSRAALARLEASFRKDGDTGDFDIDEAFTRVMSYAVLGRPGEEWNQSWQPKEWTQEEKDRMLQKISQRISQYGEDGAAVQAMVDSYLAEFDYLFPEVAAEGDSKEWSFKNLLSGILGKGEDTLGVKAAEEGLSATRDREIQERIDTNFFNTMDKILQKDTQFGVTRGLIDEIQEKLQSLPQNLPNDEKEKLTKLLKSADANLVGGGPSYFGISKYLDELLGKFSLQSAGIDYSTPISPSTSGLNPFGGM